MNTHPLAGAAARLKVDIEQKSFRSSNGGTIDVLHNLRFEVAQNEFACILGPSGCGKTTTLRILLGLERDYRGTIQLPGIAHARMGAVFQEPMLLPWRTVEQNVRLALPKDLRNTNLDSLFGQLGLSKMRAFYPAELSLGLARRAAIARALAIEPDILLLDEPFVSLDESTAQQLRHLLMSVWSERPTTALMVTHNLQEAIMLSDRIIVLSDRPAHVIGTFDIRLPRQYRNEQVKADLLRSFNEKFTAIRNVP
ncbi:ABC transporter ATP-binding protein [Phyllobacterium zundukense]|uniref:ABC transporter ATP-binding protein n=1 Tax=Phyllobacterium zundukense TaxID=1867719 RepID=A0A2N9VPI9_9HYPH|nr:ATP-binding cassette domain-containing protein [Phyllobacterium zundukense]ATU94801.1 ABC transporter ATP-binding protein [Phyllobacterium zundukense]PIO41407.1 ABC transporter ATP-binding protein [Phyllobacterium zundukense]